MSNEIISPEPTKLPQIPVTNITDPQLRPVVEGVRTIFNQRAFNKDPLERWVTWRELIGNNIVIYKDGGTTISGNGTNFFPFGEDPEDYSVPPAPQNLTATSAVFTIILEWDDPQYANLGYAEIWRSETNNIANAVRIGTTGAFLYADAVGKASLVYYYWVRFVSKKDVVGPYNSLTGTMSGTGLVGNADLSNLIITSDKIASGAINLSSDKITGLLQNANMAVISDPTKIADSLIGNTKLANLAVDAAKLADSSVTATKIANLAVGTAAIQTGAITTALIANAAIGSAQIANAAITSALIAEAAVGNAAIANAAITNAKIANLAIDSAKIADASIVTAKIADANITTAKIGDAQITNAKIAQLAVGTANIINGAITNAKIGDAEINNAKISSLDAGKINTGFLSADRIQAGSINADKIDSRNLTIKDAAGNIIFGAGTNLDWGRISNQPGNIFNGNISIGANGVLYGAGGGQVSLGGLGAGNFAFINYLDAGNITSYIAGAAIGTALIQNAAITNALIANGAISQAKIGDAEISTAKIGAAQIDTLRIAGNAVTTMGAISGTSNQTFYLNAPYGGQVVITLYIDAISIPYGGDGIVRLYVDGGLQMELSGSQVVIGFVNTGDGSGYDTYGYTPASRTILVNVGAGNHSFTVNTFSNGVSNRFYTAVGFLAQR